MTSPPPSSFAPRAVVRISGTVLAADVSARMLSVRYDDNADLADMVTLVLDNSSHRFTDSALFDLGSRLELSMGYGAELHPMMLGIIASISPAFPSGGAPTLTVTAYDLSHRLRHDHVDRSPWFGVNDSVIAAQIAAEAGLVPVVDPSRFTHTDQALPHEGTDWEFLQRRARANFFDLQVRGDRLYFRYPRPQTEAYVLEWGRTLASFTPRLSGAGQAGTQVVRGFNQELAQEIIGVATTADLGLDDLVERLGSTAVDALVSAGRRVAHGEPLRSPLDAALLARSLLEEVSEGRYEGSGDTVGVPELRAGDQVEIRGVGKRFSGRYRLRQVTHTFDSGGFRTSFEVTQRWGANLLPLLRTSAERAAPGRTPVHAGIALGTVTATDPARHQVEVQLHGRSEHDQLRAVPCMAWGAGRDRGAEFLPERGDQVVVAFEDGKLAAPVVLGSLWALADPKPAGTADVRRLRTKAHTITLDDTEGHERVVVADKGGSTVTLDHDGTVTIKAKKLVMDAGDGDIALTAGKVLVSVKDHMDVSAKGGV